MPVADGGDGTLDVLLAAAGDAARVDWVRVTGPLGRVRRARLGWARPGVAVVEMAEATGLRLVPPGHRDPMRATSRGAGDLIRAALDRGADRVLVGVGGSASTDGGAGILAALGVRLLDARGRPVPDGGGFLEAIAAVDLGGLDPRLASTRIEVAVDVFSPLSGEKGAAFVFAPQKGADAGQATRLDAGLRHLASLVESAFGAPGLSHRPGSGAAGGAGFALASVGAALVGGAALVCDEVGLDRALADAAIVITGEGRLDGQTAAGKAPAEVAQRARAAGVPCVAVAGRVAGATDLFDATIALDSLDPEPQRRVRSLLRRAGALAAAEARGAPQRTA
jgi:glycerate kinase